MRLLLLGLLALLLAACGRGEPSRIADFRSLGELRVGTRLDAISYREEADGSASGYEHDLIQRLGERLGVPVKFVVYPDAARALDAVLNGEVHLAAAGLAQRDTLPLRWTAPLREVEYVLVGGIEVREIEHERDLAGLTIGVRRGTLAAEVLERIRKRVPDIKVVHPARGGDQQLLERVAAGKLDLAATDRVQYVLASELNPGLNAAFELPIKSTIAWALPLAEQPLAEDIDAFLAGARSTRLMERLADRYFSRVRRLNEADIATFVERIGSRLPQFRPYFHEAQARTGIDWRFLAALAYQESHWDPLATSRTGVRGMMMLTAETADRLGVADRLDARESILGGARYFAMLRDALPDEIAEPDRSWMTTAAYNLGMGHMNGARSIARGLGRDDTSWWDMKTVLPLLSRPEYAARLKSGPARGGEAVVMTENVRGYYDILGRLAPAFEPPLLPRSLASDGRKARLAGSPQP